MVMLLILSPRNFLVGLPLILLLLGFIVYRSESAAVKCYACGPSQKDKTEKCTGNKVVDCGKPGSDTVFDDAETLNKKSGQTRRRQTMVTTESPLEEDACATLTLASGQILKSCYLKAPEDELTCKPDNSSTAADKPMEFCLCNTDLCNVKRESSVHSISYRITPWRFWHHIISLILLSTLNNVVLVLALSASGTLVAPWNFIKIMFR